MKRVVQTIGKTKSGGVIPGLTDSYQSPVSLNKLPKNPVKNTTAKQKIKTPHFIFINIKRNYYLLNYR